MWELRGKLTRSESDAITQHYKQPSLLGHSHSKDGYQGRNSGLSGVGEFANNGISIGCRKDRNSRSG